MTRDAVFGAWGVSVFACLLASCVHQAAVGSVKIPHVAAPPAVNLQTSNAVYTQNGDAELNALRRKLAADPRDLGARLALARRYSDLDLPDLAIEHCRLAVAQFPESPLAALALAAALREAREPAQALAAVREGIANQKAGNWQLYSMKGILEDDLGDRQTAEASHRAAIEFAPKRGTLHNNLGFNFYLQQRYSEAAEEFRRAISLDSSLEAAHSNLAAALASGPAPSSAEALSEWQRVGGPAAAHNNMGALLMEQQRWNEAREELREALKFQRDMPAALSNLQFASEADGQPVTAPAVEPPGKPARGPSVFSRIFKRKGSTTAAQPDAQERVTATTQANPSDPAARAGGANLKDGAGRQ